MTVAFLNAVEIYTASAEAESDFDLLDKLELAILKHLPQSVPEVVHMLRIVLPNLEGGGRGDGADVLALSNIVDFLDQSA